VLVGHPTGHLIAAFLAVEPVLLGIGRRRGVQPAIDLGLKLRLPQLHAVVAHRLVLGGVRLDLGTIERHVPELPQAGLLGEPQNLHEETGKRG
jgi:hypothetical protein